MILDEFMLEFFKSNDTVTVNANELQSLARNSSAKSMQIQVLTERLNKYESKLKSLKEKCNALELNKPMYIDLKG